MNIGQTVVAKEEFVSKKRVLISTIIVVMAVLACLLIFLEHPSIDFLGSTLLFSTLLATVVVIYKTIKFKVVSLSVLRSGKYSYANAMNEKSIGRRNRQILVIGIAFLILALLPLYLALLMEATTVFVLVIGVSLGLNLGELIFSGYVKWWEKKHNLLLAKHVVQTRDVWSRLVTGKEKANEEE